MPRLFAVQAATCAPVYQAFRSGAETIAPIAPETTRAGSIAISQPVRVKQILKAIQATDGDVIIVTEEEMVQAHSQLAHRGFYVEETSATAIAAVTALRERLPSESSIVVPLTGHGLKTRPEN
jgi:threonine synthase